MKSIIKESKQEFMSAGTSINSTKLPAVYKKINWGFIQGYSHNEKFIVLDYGCGRYISHIKKYIESIGGEYHYYDPTWYPDKTSLLCNPDAIICASVLNVIKEDSIVLEIVKNLLNYNVPTFITVYEGNGSGVGRNSKKGCWQRNQKYHHYLFHQEFPQQLAHYHGVISNWPSLIK